MGFDWSAANISRLRHLWEVEKLSAAAIGREMNVSKDAVISKAHRLALTSRENPTGQVSKFTAPVLSMIRDLAKTSLTNREIAARVGCSKDGLKAKMREMGISRARNKGRRAVKNVPHKHIKNVPHKHIPPTIAAPLIGRHIDLFLESRNLPKRRAAVSEKTTGRIEPCCWPIGMPKTSSFRYCDVPSMRGRPYCEEHASIAFASACDRREDAA